MWYTLCGHPGKSRQNAERQDLGHMPLLGSAGRVLWGSGAMTGLVNSNQKSRGLISSTGVLSKGNIRGRPQEAGEDS